MGALNIDTFGGARDVLGIARHGRPIVRRHWLAIPAAPTTDDTLQGLLIMGRTHAAHFNTRFGSGWLG
jgi:hypothetical protein